MARTRLVPVPEGGFKRIAVLRMSSLGDVVLTLPVAHALRRAFPDAHLTFWTKEEYRDAVRFDPALSHVRVLEADARRIEDLVSMSAELEACDLIVDLHGSARSRVLTFRQKAPVLRVAHHRLLRARWVHARWSRPAPAPHTLERYAAVLAPIGVAPDGPPRLAAGAEAEAWARDWLAEWDREAARAGPDTMGPIVALCPGARHFTKRWPETHWEELDVALTAAGYRRVYLSLPAERDALPSLAEQVASARGARWCVEPLSRMAAILSHCAAAVSNDSGLMHVAAARGLRVVALFGSTAPELGFAPVGEGHAVLCRHEPCQPCTLHGRARCPQGHFRCMLGIEAAEVAVRVRAIAAVAN